MTSPRLRTALCLSALAVSAAAAAPSQSLAASCKSGGLGYEYTDGGASFSIGVRDLKATGGASCRKARKIARTTALAVLFRGDVPKKPEGFNLELDRPCGNCPPVWSGVATRGSHRVTFTLRGGV